VEAARRLDTLSLPRGDRSVEGSRVGLVG
jgi:hypothetical protein